MGALISRGDSKWKPDVKHNVKTLDENKVCSKKEHARLMHRTTVKLGVNMEEAFHLPNS